MLAPNKRSSNTNRAVARQASLKGVSHWRPSLPLALRLRFVSDRSAWDGLTQQSIISVWRTRQHSPRSPSDDCEPTWKSTSILTRNPSHRVARRSWRLLTCPWNWNVPIPRELISRWLVENGSQPLRLIQPPGGYSIAPKTASANAAVRNRQMIGLSFYRLG